MRCSPCLSYVGHWHATRLPLAFLLIAAPVLAVEQQRISAHISPCFALNVLNLPRSVVKRHGCPSIPPAIPPFFPFPPLQPFFPPWPLAGDSTIPFPLFEVQANAVAAAISGRCTIPSLAEREQWLLDDEQKWLQEEGVASTSRGLHVLGDRQLSYSKRILRLAGGPGVMMRPPYPGRFVGGGSGDVSSGNGHVFGDCAALPRSSPEEEAELLSTLEMKTAVNNDASKTRPTFPGGPDDYRRQMYTVDRESGIISVCWAKHKANGEGPSADAAAAAYGEAVPSDDVPEIAKA